MVGNVLGKDHEGHGHVGREQGDKVAEVQLLEGALGLREGEAGHREEGGQAEGGEALGKRLKADDLQHLVAGGLADQIEDACPG